MKKIILGILLIVSVFSLSSCKVGGLFSNEDDSTKDQAEDKQLENPVTLSKLVAESASTKTNEIPNYQHVILMNGITDFILTIHLSNINNYYILDLKLACDDENAKVFVDSEYKLLSDLKSIKWSGDSKNTLKLKMQVSSTEVLNTVELTSMHYSDKADGSSKYNVNLNNKGKLDVYKFSDGVKVNVVGYEKYSITPLYEYVDVNSIKANLSPYVVGSTFNNNVNEFEVTYSFIFGDYKTPEYSIVFTKPEVCLSYTCNPYPELHLNPVYIDEDGCEVSIYNKSTRELVEKVTITKQNNPYRCTSVTSDVYYIIDGIGTINK